MSEENNIYENNNEETQYTPTQEPTPVDAAVEDNVAADNTYYSEVVDNTAADNTTYTGEPVDYSSGKGQGKGLGIASMICGILALIMSCCIPVLPVILGIIAVVLGIIQIVKNESKGMAIAGIICGAIGLLMGIYVILCLALVMGNQALYYDVLDDLAPYGLY